MRQRTSYDQDLSLSKLATDYRTPTVYNERMARALVWNTQTTYTYLKQISSVTGIMFGVDGLKSSPECRTYRTHTYKSRDKDLFGYS